MSEEELIQIGKYSEKKVMTISELANFKFLLIKWMYEQGMLE